MSGKNTGGKSYQQSENDLLGGGYGTNRDFLKISQPVIRIPRLGQYFYQQYSDQTGQENGNRNFCPRFG